MRRNTLTSERLGPLVLGIDVGSNNLKLCLREGKSMRLISRRLPENMVRDGEVASPETMATFLRALRQEEGIRERACALVVNSSQAFFRHVTLPPMNVSELMLNLPYEFRDFIADDPESYVYDYAVDDLVRGEDGQLQHMELFAGAVSKSLVERYTTILHKAGFRLRMITPAPMAYARLLHQYALRYLAFTEKDFMLVDIGHQSVVVSLFRGQHYDSARTIDFGCSELDHAIADIKGVDPYTASSYKYTNFEGVLDDPACTAVCGRMAMEVSKVINFYNFNNPDREIDELCLMGGGARIPQVVDAISEMVSVPTTDVSTILPRQARDQQDAQVCALALASMLEGESM